MRQTPDWRTRLQLFVPLRSWRLQLLAVAAAVILAILSAQSFASASGLAATYLIQPGDTLSVIANTTGVPVDRIISLNSIQDPNVIIAGKSLSLSGGAQGATATTPSASSSTAASPAQYTVKQGDTLWGIAQSNGAQVADIVQLNSLSNADQLKVGQVLQLPITAGPVQRSASVAPQTPASPKPKPAAGTSTLQQKVAAEAVRVGGSNAHVGVAALNLTTGDSVAWHADDEFPSASVMKLPILVELERQIAAGQLSWTESLRAEVSAMITVSDNTAANEIAAAIRPQSVNATMGRLGLGGTQFANLFNDARSPANPGENQTTPSNMMKLLQLIATDQIVNAQVSGDIRGLLARNADRSKLVRSLPADAQVAHKSGWYDGVANDVGIVTVNRLPAKWVIAVFSENVPDAETGNQLIAAVSKAVYDAWAPAAASS